MNAVLVLVLLPSALFATLCLEHWLPQRWYIYWASVLSLWLPQKLWYVYRYRLDRQQTSTAIRSHWIWKIVIASPLSPAYLLCVLTISFQLSSWFYLLSWGRPFFNDDIQSFPRRDCLEYYGIYTVHTRSVTLLPPDVTHDTNMTAEDPTDIKPLGEQDHPYEFLSNLQRSEFDPYPRNFVLLPWVPVIERCVTCNDSKEYECYYKHPTCSVSRLAAMYFSGKRGKVLSTQDPETYYCTALGPNKNLLPTSERNINEVDDPYSFVSVSRRSFNNFTRSRKEIFPHWVDEDRQPYSYFCVEPSRQILANIGTCKNEPYGMRNDTVFLERIHPLFRFLILETDFMAYFNIHIQTAIRYRYVLIIFSLGWPITGPIILFVSLWLGSRGLLLTLIGYPPETMFYYEYIEDPYPDPSDHAWLVAACHRLDAYLEDVMDARIITVDQFDWVHKRQLEKGKIYGLRLLRHCIIDNQTIEQLRRIVHTYDLNLPDGHQSATSSDTSSDVEREDPFHYMTFISLFYANEGQPGLEDLLPDILSRHQYVRICDTRVERGDLHAARLLVYIIRRKNRVDRFMERYCSQLQIPEYQRSGITRAIEHSN